MSVRGSIVLFAGLLAAALILAGCGGGGSDSTTAGSDSTTAGSDSTAAPLTKTAFIKQADAVCANGLKRTQSEYAAYLKEKKIPAEKEPTPAQFAEISDEIQIPALKRQEGELHALGVPLADKAQVAALFDAIDEGIGKVEKADPQTALESTASLLSKADKLAVEYGLTVCGSQR